jgi:hypothetical protein
MQRTVNQNDVTRIVRSVASALAVKMSLVSVEPSGAGWHVTITDVAGRVISTDLPTGPPATIRAAAREWLDSEV